MVGFKSVVLVCIVFVALEPRSVICGETPKCECGVFKFPTAETTEETPVFEKTPQFNFVCNSDGKESCSNICQALAKASKEDGPKELCKVIGDTDVPFVPVIYYKACNDKDWTYTGFKSTLEICCKAKEPVPCA